jgi:hypothetical protein
MVTDRKIYPPKEGIRARRFSPIGSRRKEKGNAEREHKPQTGRALCHIKLLDAAQEIIR